MSLYTELVKKKARIKNSFWDSQLNGYEFSKLNNVDQIDISPATLRNIQINTLTQYMEIDNRMKAANSFLGQVNSYKSEKTEEEGANAIFQRISSILNSPFSTGSAELRESQTINRVTELKNLFKSIKVDLPISKTIIDALSTNATLKNKSTLFYNYRREKSQLFENIAAAFIQGNFGQAITTGSWGNVDHYNQQLITDIYAMMNDNPTTLEKGYYGSYKKSGYWKADVQRAKDAIHCNVDGTDVSNFLDTMKKLNGNSQCSIFINDELQDTLDTISSLQIQAKSGINQSIINNSFRSAITLDEIKLKGDSTLNLLLDLYNLESANGFKYLYKNQSGENLPTLNGYANYLLSKSIQKTSLVQSNNIYFTENGFETVYGWMSRKENLYLAFQHKIKLNANLLSANRKYSFQGVK